MFFFWRTAILSLAAYLIQALAPALPSDGEFFCSFDTPLYSIYQLFVQDSK